MLIEWQSQQNISIIDTTVHPVCTAPPQPNPTTLSLAIRAVDPQSNLKRVRLQTDVEGENSVDIHRKKRRLRVNLVTSRLSLPYATPATHIIPSRRTQRLGPWSRPRLRVHSPLRRAAILNAIRARETTARPIGRREVSLLKTLKSKPESDHTEIDLVTNGIRTPSDSPPEGNLPQGHIPPSPSPLGPPNYNAFDEEDDHFDEDDMDSADEGEDVYSNFNDLEDTETNTEDYESLCPFGGDVEDYSRPWKDETTAENVDMNVETGKPLQTKHLPGLHGV
ncbi:MAG: hypothetical protein Q9209_001746 [Squamulea sp. 1 TL-2023]